MLRLIPEEMIRRDEETKNLVDDILSAEKLRNSLSVVLNARLPNDDKLKRIRAEVGDDRKDEEEVNRIEPEKEKRVENEGREEKIGEKAPVIAKEKPKWLHLEWCYQSDRKDIPL